MRFVEVVVARMMSEGNSKWELGSGGGWDEMHGMDVRSEEPLVKLWQNSWRGDVR